MALYSTQRIQFWSIRDMFRIVIFLFALGAGDLLHAESHTESFSKSGSFGNSGPVVAEELLRYFGFKVYTVRLSIPARGIDPLTDVKKEMTLTYHRDFTANDITAAARRILKRKSSVDFQAIEARLDQIDAVYRDVKSGDSYTLAYTPGVGTSLLLNGINLTTVTGADFAKAYFGLWLSEEDPISASLRRGLLEKVGVLEAE